MVIAVITFTFFFAACGGGGGGGGSDDPVVIAPFSFEVKGGNTSIVPAWTSGMTLPLELNLEAGTIG